MNSRNSFFAQNVWSKKEFILILGLILVVVPVLLEHLLAQYLSNLLGNDLYSGTLVGLIMAITFMVGVYFIALRPKGLSWREVGLKSFPPSYWKGIVMWTVALIAVTSTLVIMMDLLGGVGVKNSKTESLQSGFTIPHFLIGFLSAAVISPIYEEILYRGFCYRWLRARFTVPMSLFLSSFLFMIVHIPTYNTLPTVFITGLVFAKVYERTASVIPGMIIHGLFNGIAVTLTVIG